MTAKKTNHNYSYSVVFTLFCILVLVLAPQHLHAQLLRIVYSNDILGELAPCG